MTLGIVSYGVHLPVHRLALAEVAAAFGSGSGRGRRVVAAFDEDSTTMAVAAARGLVPDRSVESLWFATTSPAYAEKTNAAAVHAALGLGAETFAVDVVGAVRSGEGALRAAAGSGGLAVLADVRVGRPGSADETQAADGAAAFRFGPSAQALAVPVARACATAELLDRWRLPSELTASQWEERFGLDSYAPLVATTAGRALADAGLASADLVVVSSPHTRVAADALARLGGADALPMGNAGAADVGIRLADALDRAQPGNTILVVSVSDGVVATVWRATDRIDAARPAVSVRQLLAAGRDVPYPTYLTWRGLLEREAPRRPEPERPAAPPSARNLDWKFAFVGSRCDKCGFLHLPPQRVCASCRTVDVMSAAPLTEAIGSVVTFTVDRLAYSLSPPVICAVIDFDGGGRCLLELADADPAEVVVGARVGLTFRRLWTTENVHNYFWKAALLGGESLGQ
jgi:3-hydroxy-3-methylglutaryl CoA synthase/uncharacterized OB-fold protein